MVLGRVGNNAAHRRRSSSDSTNPAFSEPLRALELAFREADARRAEGYRRGVLPGGPTLVEQGPLRILISAAPAPDAVARYAALLRSHSASHVVRVCDPTYPASRLRGANLTVHDWAFADGDAPPPSVVDNWLALLDDVFALGSPDRHTAPTQTVAVHCMAGLGRAPVLVAVALVEFGMNPFEAVGWLRALRRGAINARQMAFLEAYIPRSARTPVRPRRQRSSLLVEWFKGYRIAYRPKLSTPSPVRVNPVSVAGSR